MPTALSSPWYCHSKCWLSERMLGILSSSGFTKYVLQSTNPNRCSREGGLKAKYLWKPLHMVSPWRFPVHINIVKALTHSTVNRSAQFLKLICQEVSIRCAILPITLENIVLRGKRHYKWSSTYNGPIYDILTLQWYESDTHSVETLP